MWPSDLARYAPDATPEELLDASFRFLLEREPKEAILGRFELPITGPLTVNLRAERSGTGTGRIYTIQVEGRDATGNTTLQAVSVAVPLDR